MVGIPYVPSPPTGAPIGPYPAMGTVRYSPARATPTSKPAAASKSGSALTKGRGTGAKPAVGPAGNPLVDMMLGMLGQGGSAGGGGSYTPGYNGEPARQAARSAYDTQLGNTKKVYGQIVGSVKDRAPAIQQGYEQATAKINADAQARAAADAARNLEADTRNAQTAAALGLNVAQPNGTAADVMQQAGSNAYNQNAQAWAGFNGAAAQTALERNTATGDAFTHAGAETETALGSMLQQALAAIAGQEAANPARYSGGGGGRSSAGMDFKILQELMDYDMNQQELAAKTSGKTSPLAGLSPSGWQAVAQAYGGVSSMGMGKAQAQSLALKQLANNPRDFATLFSAING